MKTNKPFLVLLLASLICLSGALSVCADGMVLVKPDPYSDRWDYASEADQQAYINYQNGLQKMIVGIKMNAASDADAVWLFPVPADPSKVVIDVVTDLPQINGQEVSAKAKASLSEAKDLLFKSQLYPLLFWQNDYYGSSYDMSEGVAMSNSLKESVSPAAQDVVVYETLDKEGMTTEIIAAKTANGLYDYFKLKGLKIEAGMIPVLDSYIGKDFSFVASWIDKQAQGTIIPVVFSGSSMLCDDQRIVADLREWLLSPTLQDFFVSLTERFPQIAAVREPDGAVSMDLDAAEAYLKSDEGKAALNEIIGEIKNNTALGKKCLAAGNQIGGKPYSELTSYPRNAVKGVSVMFPTDKIYFPLLPTSVYESKIVPATIKVAGFVTPRLFDGIKNFSKVTYYTNAASYGGQNTGFFGSDNVSDYTKIEINPPSKYLTDDLWITNKAPLKTAYASLVGNHPLAVSLILLVFCSVLAGLLAGLILLKDLRHSIKKLLLLGLANCLSILGLIAATFYAIARQDYGEEAALMEKLKQKGYIWKRKAAQVLFCLAAISLAFIMAEVAWSSMYVGDISLIFVYLPVVLAFFGWRAARVSYEDMPLFAELEKKGYSTWTMRQKGPDRKIFIVFYSLLFLAISWLLIKLLMMTV